MKYDEMLKSMMNTFGTKIAFVGTQNSGKTTRVKYLSSRFEKVGVRAYVLKEGIRDCPYPINENTKYETQKWMLDWQIENEEIATKYYPIVLADRSVIDPIVYAMWANIAGNITDDQLEKLKMIARPFVDTYDMIVWCRSFGKIQDDGLRNKKIQYQQQIDELFARILSEWNVKHTEASPWIGALDVDDIRLK